jgi:cell wall-associated NlpC family hydrolase
MPTRQPETKRAAPPVKRRTPREGTRGGRFAVLALMVLVASVLGAMMGQGALGDPQQKIEQKLGELDRIQSSEGSLRDQIDSMNAEVDQLIGEESRLREQLAVVEQELDQKQAELDQATAELNAQKAELARVRAKLQDSVAALEQLLVEMYKSNEPDLTSVVMRSASWSDLLTRTEYLDHIRTYDDEVVARVRGLRDQITALVAQLQVTHDKIQTARDEIAVKERELADQHAQIQAQQSKLVAARSAREKVLEALLAKEEQIQEDLSDIPAPAGRAVLASNGDAIPPSNAPLAVRAVIDAANQINDMPYIWGGGHGSFEASGYDCSGAVSYALHGGGFLSSPLDSTGLMFWGEPGGGNWITVFAHSGHAWAYIAGLRWDTGGPGGGNGPRWSSVMRTDASSYVARHPAGY